MKIYKQLSVLAVILLTGFSCNDNAEKKCMGSYEFIPPNLTDTVNLKDCNGWKQGKWIPSSTNNLKDTLYYHNDTIVQ